MGFRARRLRRGELLVWPAALVLLVDLFSLPWYATGSVMTVSMTGWESLSVIRWLVLVTGLSGLALTWFQGTRRAPALPSTLSVIAATLGAITTIALVWRVVIDTPGANTSANGGAWIALVAGLALFTGAVWSLREEDPPDLERNAGIPIVPLPK